MMALPSVNVRTFEADNQWNLKADFFHSSYNAFGDHVTTHDATKDVDQDAFDVWIRGDDLERFGYFFFGRAATYVKEVCWLCAVQLDDVHCGHRQGRRRLPCSRFRRPERCS